MKRSLIAFQALLASSAVLCQTAEASSTYTANSSIDKTALLPFRPYGRSGISCIVNQNNGKLLSSTNIALGQMMQAYMDGDAGTRRMINRWIGPGSDVGLSQESIRALYGLILSVIAEINTSATPGI